MTQSEVLAMIADHDAKVRPYYRAPRGDDVPKEREEYPDNGPTDPWQTSGPGRET